MTILFMNMYSCQGIQSFSKVIEANNELTLIYRHIVIIVTWILCYFDSTVKLGYIVASPVGNKHQFPLHPYTTAFISSATSLLFLSPQYSSLAQLLTYQQFYISLPATASHLANISICKCPSYFHWYFKNRSSKVSPWSLTYCYQKSEGNHLLSVDGHARGY